METEFELQVPNYENPFKTLESLDRVETYVSESLLEDVFCVIDFPCKNFDNLVDTLTNKLTKHFKEQTTSGKIVPGQRLQDAIDIPEVLEIADNQRIIEILSNVYGKKAFPFQTLNFPSSTEQLESIHICIT